MPRPRPTLAQVAKRANVSVTTASAAIRGVGRVNPETRDQVLAVAQAVGYRTHSGAASLRTGSSVLVGMVLEPSAFDDDSINFKLFWPRLLNSFAQELTSVGIGVALVVRDDLRPLSGLPIEALVVLADLVGTTDLQLPFGMPVISGAHGAEGGATVSHDYAAIARECREHLVAMGATSLALLVPDRHLPTFEIIRDAFNADCIVAGIPGELTSTHTGALAESLERGVDAFFTLGEDVAGLVEFIQQTGRSIPQDTMVLSMSESDTGLRFEPSITTLSFCGRLSGIELAHVVIESVSQGRTVRAVLPHELTIRESTLRR